MKKILAFLLILTACQPIHIVLDEPITADRAIGWQDMYAKYNYRDSTTFDVMSEFEDGARIGDYKDGSDVVVLDSVTTDGTNVYFYNGATILTAVPGVGSAAWGSISGTLTNQVDLTNALGLKANIASPTFTGTVGGITAAMVGAMSTSHAANAITGANIANWNTAYGWGNHAGLYELAGSLASYVPITRTVNGHALNANISVTASDVSLGNLTNKAQIELEDSVNYANGYMSRYDGVTGLALKINRADSSSVAEPNSYATGNMLEDGLALKLNVANPTATGTLTTPALRVGDATSNTIAGIDSIGYVGTSLAFYDGTDTVPVYDLYSGRIDLYDAMDTSAVIATKHDLYQFPSYIIEQIGDSVYANPAPRSGYTVYADTNLTGVLQDVIDELTSGGLIQIKAGLYDNMDSISINNDGITFQGEGMYLTKLKLRGEFDVDRDAASFMNLKNSKHTTFRDLELDGNLANQTKLDNNIFGDGYYIFCTGIYGNSGTVGPNHPDDFLAENCYIHDFSGNGITVFHGDRPIVRNCRVEDSGSNQISFTGHVEDGIIENNLVSGGGDVTISLGAGDHHNYNCIVRNNMVLDVNGSYGSTGSHYGIEIGGTKGQILDNYISGPNIVRAIYGMPAAKRSVIKGNVVDSLKTASFAIALTTDSAAVIMNNVLTDISGDGIVLTGCKGTIIMGNHITTPAGSDAAIAFTNYTTTHTTGSYIANNYLYSLGSIGINFISSACNDNIIVNNYIYGAGIDRYIPTTTTGTIWRDNYGYKMGTWLPETGNWQKTATATSDGLTTGILEAGNQNVTVTSSNAAYIICLPAAGATTIGTKITGQVGANGFELRVQAAQATTVYLNNVTTNVEAAIPASTYFEVVCVDATHWILKAWTMLGAELTAIIPDAV